MENFHWKNVPRPLNKYSLKLVKLIAIVFSTTFMKRSKISKRSSQLKMSVLTSNYEGLKREQRS